MADDQPRYTAKRMREEISRAKEYARRDALEEAALIAEAEPEFEEEPTPEVVKAMHAVGPINNARAACAVTKKSIAKAIRALAVRAEPTKDANCNATKSIDRAEWVVSASKPKGCAE